MGTGGWSGARLDRTHEAMAGRVERGEVPGLVTLVARRDEVRVDAVGSKAVGGDPMRRDTIFRISSLTKPIAAAAAPRRAGGSAAAGTGRPQGPQSAQWAA
jgi:CubicO group peptidase (beta-lactamase class C family)